MTEAQRLKEEVRLKEMWQLEEEHAHLPYIAGVDEAGRGPLAGPVVAATAILPKEHLFYFLNDSKKMTEKRREELFLILKKEAIAYGIGIVSPEEIDRINMLQATYKAMRIALQNMKEQFSLVPRLLFNDAVTIPDVEIAQIPIIHGDARSLSIAAASVLAKVTRDHIMLSYDEKYPLYGFAKHKGYGTKAHREAILCYGPSPIHRSSFLKKLYQGTGD